MSREQVFVSLVLLVALGFVFWIVYMVRQVGIHEQAKRAIEDERDLAFLGRLARVVETSPEVARVVAQATILEHVSTLSPLRSPIHSLVSDATREHPDACLRIARSAIEARHEAARTVAREMAQDGKLAP